MNILDIIGLEVVTIRGFNSRKKIPKKIKPEYILFSDKKTYIELREQDMEYHDCSFLAREINVYQDLIRWGRMFSDKQHYPEATEGIGGL